MGITVALDNEYRVDGVLMEMAPVSVQWTNQTFGYQGDSRPVNSAYWDVIMTFQGGIESWVEPWLNKVGSKITVQVPDKWGLTFVLLTDVYFDIQAYPILTDVNWGDFTLAIKGVLVV